MRNDPLQQFLFENVDISSYLFVRGRSTAPASADYLENRDGRYCVLVKVVSYLREPISIRPLIASKSAGGSWYQLPRVVSAAT
jgi:hypothetical protein